MSLEKKTCFIITPISETGSDIRREAEGVIDAVINPVLKELNFDVEVAHRISESGSITKQIIRRIINSDLVIANLTGLNPNVMYELAIRHAARKPVIQLIDKDMILPFDINDERTIFYKNDMLGVVELKQKLKTMIDSALNEEFPDNPIYRAIESELILETVKESEPEKYIILKKLEEMEDKIDNLLVKSSFKSDLEVKNKETILYLYFDSEISEKEIKEIIDTEIEKMGILLYNSKLHLNKDGWTEQKYKYTILTYENIIIKYLSQITSHLENQGKIENNEIIRIQ